MAGRERLNRMERCSRADKRMLAMNVGRLLAQSLREVEAGIKLVPALQIRNINVDGARVDWHTVTGGRSREITN
jgi:hypothetical protein